MTNLKSIVERKSLAYLAQYIHSVSLIMPSETVAEKVDRINIRNLKLRIMEKHASTVFRKPSAKIPINVSLNEFAAMDIHIDFENMLGSPSEIHDFVIVKEFMQPLFNQFKILTGC